MKSRIGKLIMRIIFSTFGLFAIITIVLPLLMTLIDWILDDEHDFIDSTIFGWGTFAEMVRGEEE